VRLHRGDRSSDAALVLVSINGTRMSALMDTGAPGTTLSLASARKAGIDPGRMKPVGRASGLGEDKVNRWLADVDSFQIGGEKITHQRLMVDDVDHDHHDMLLGLDYFLAHRIYVSRLQGKVYATWNGTDVFAQHPGAARNNFDTRYALKPDDLPADDADALARRGMAFQTKGDLPRALEDLNRAIALKPSEAAFLLARARVKLSLREQDAAMTDLDEVLRLDATQTEARLLRADLRIEHHDIEAAQADLRALDAELPPSAAQRARMGDIYAAMDQVAPAVKQYELWLVHHDSDGQQAQVLTRRCWLRTRLGVDLQAALKDCQRGISKDPDVAIYRSNLGWLYLRLGDSQSALAAFNKAIEMNARLGWAFFGRAVTEFGLKDTTSAERDLQTARRLRPGIDQAVRQAGFRLPEGLQAPANEAAGADKG
jgi:tetratricopeptide (TPR) repeat protein